MIVKKRFRICKKKKNSNRFIKKKTGLGYIKIQIPGPKTGFKKH